MTGDIVLSRQINDRADVQQQLKHTLQTINQEYIFINVSASSALDSCRLNWNGTWDNTMTVSGNYCYITKSGSFNNTYTYYVEGTGSNAAMNITVSKNVTMIYNPSSPPSNSGLAKIFPVQGFVSILLTISLLFGYFLFN